MESPLWTQYGASYITNQIDTWEDLSWHSSLASMMDSVIYSPMNPSMMFERINPSLASNSSRTSLLTELLQSSKPGDAFPAEYNDDDDDADHDDGLSPLQHCDSTDSLQSASLTGSFYLEMYYPVVPTARPAPLSHRFALEPYNDDGPGQVLSPETSHKCMVEAELSGSLQQQLAKQRQSGSGSMSHLATAERQVAPEKMLRTKKARKQRVRSFSWARGFDFGLREYYLAGW